MDQMPSRWAITSLEVSLTIGHMMTAAVSSDSWSHAIIAAGQPSLFGQGV
jgi:hypothetical protein